MPNTTARELTVTRRPRYADGDPDPKYDDYMIVINGNVIGGTEYDTAGEHPGTYSSWGLLHSGGHATREAAEQAQADAARTADLPVLEIRILPDAAYRVAVGGGEDLTETGATVQLYLDAAARCAAAITGTSDAFTIDHNNEWHLGRVCEHDGHAVTYRPQSEDEPNVVPASLQRIPTDRAPLPETGPAGPELWQLVVDHMQAHHTDAYDAGWQIIRSTSNDTIGVVFLPGVFGSMEGARRLNLYAWERTLREAGFAATVRHDMEFTLPNSPTIGPWWVHVTGATPRPAPVTLTKDAVTLYDIATNTVWEHMSHRHAEGDLEMALDCGDVLQEHATADRRGNPLRVVLHTIGPGGKASGDYELDTGGVYEFAP